MNIDLVIVLAYLLFTLIYGIYVGRNVNNIKDFALGGKKFSTPVLAATIIATYASSSGFMIDLTQSYEDGLYNFISLSGQILGILIIGLIVSPKVKRFDGMLSTSDILAYVYGKNVRILSSIPIIFNVTGFLALQVNVIASVFSYFGNFDSFYSVIFSALVITVYSGLGGIRAVTMTDFIQFLTFGVVVPIIFIIVYQKLNLPMDEANKNALIDKISYFPPDKKSYYLTFGFYLMIPAMNPPVLQRIFMAKNVSQVKSSFKVSALALLVMAALANFLGCMLYVSNPNLESSSVLPYLVDTFLPTGITGLVLIGILAMAMSSADSNLNSGAVAFAHDFCKPLNILKKYGEVTTAKIFSIFIGIFSIILALHFKDLIQLILFVGGFYACTITIPLLFAIFGFKSTEKTVIIGMASGIITVASWDYVMSFFAISNPIDSFIPGMLAHAFGLLFSHYALKQPGGWGHDKDPNQIISKKKSRLSSLYFLIKKTWRNFTLSPVSIFKSLRANMPQSIAVFNNLAIYCFIIYFFMFTYYGNITNQEIVIFCLVLVCSIGLLLSNIATHRMGNLFSLIYFLSTTFCLPFASTYMILTSNFSMPKIIISMLSVIMMPMLMSWYFAIFANLFAVGLSYTIFTLLNPDSHIKLSDNGIIDGFFFITVALIFWSFFISRSNWNYVRSIMLHNKALNMDRLKLNKRIAINEQNLEKLYNVKSEILNNFSHEVRTPISTTGNFLDMAIFEFNKISKDTNISSNYLMKVKERLDLSKQNFVKLSEYILRLADLSDFQKNNIIFDFKETTLKSILDDIKNNYSNKINFDIRFSDPKIENQIIYTDPLRLEFILEEIVKNSIIHAESSNIEINFSKYENGIKINLKDYANSEVLTIDNISKLTEGFEVGAKGKKGYRGLGLALCVQIIKFLGGTIDARIHRDQKYGGVSVNITLPEILHNNNQDLDEETEKSDRKRVLVVDDDIAVIMSSTMILESLNCDVITAETGSDAIKILTSQIENIDILFLDIMMPDKDGLEVLSEINGLLKGRGKHLKIILQSGVGTLEDVREKASSLGVHGFCPKPYTTEHIKKLI
jgi:Na+/proline symporter/signal transduction histidine kinase/CheY-like chemotaxis protein